MPCLHGSHKPAHNLAILPVAEARNKGAQENGTLRLTREHLLFAPLIQHWDHGPIAEATHSAHEAIGTSGGASVFDVQLGIDIKAHMDTGTRTPRITTIRHQQQIMVCASNGVPF